MPYGRVSQLRWWTAHGSFDRLTVGLKRELGAQAATIGICDETNKVDTEFTLEEARQLGETLLALVDQAGHTTTSVPPDLLLSA